MQEKVIDLSMNSICFSMKVDDHAILIVAAGGAQIDNSKYKSQYVSSFL